jgi:SpoVK/Ycf46/Vps4 family AAA+-type ATPase
MSNNTGPNNTGPNNTGPNDNKNGKRYRNDDDTINSPNKKKNTVFYYLEDDDDVDLLNLLNNYNNNNNNYNNNVENQDLYTEIKEEDKEFIEITKEVNNLNDLIELGKMYDSNKRYNIDLKILNKLVDSLTELNNMIGMETVKQDMVDHILFRIQNLDKTNQDMMHTVIQGPPGVGKTEVAKIIGKVYLAMGILKNNKFVKARHSDLIAGYLGQTARATQKIIESADGGVLFIDEVYSLGNSEKRDSFSKECIDTINDNLTEKKTDFICIIAGYKDEIDDCFFAYNSGLQRRFPVRFTIDPYNPEELFLIFEKKITDFGWYIDKSIKVDFFKDNIDSFEYYGGDIEILFSRCKRAHSRRVFTSKESEKKIITNVDLQRGFQSFVAHKKEKQKEMSETWKTMFM